MPNNDTSPPEWNCIHDMAETIKVFKRLEIFNKKHGMMKNATHYQNQIAVHQHKLDVTEAKIAKRKIYKMKIHKLERGED